MHAEPPYADTSDVDTSSQEKPRYATLILLLERIAGAEFYKYNGFGVYTLMRVGKDAGILGDDEGIIGHQGEIFA